MWEEAKLKRNVTHRIFPLIAVFQSHFSCPDNMFHRPTLTANMCRGCRESVWDEYRLHRSLLKKSFAELCRVEKCYILLFLTLILIS